MAQKTIERPRQAVILAGGLGTRLLPITENIPKPMIRFNDKPFLEYLIVMLKEQGFNEVLLLLGYLPEKIIEYFGDGKDFGLSIKYSISPVEDDTGYRLKKAKNFLQPYFFLMYCDNYWPIDFNKIWKHFLSRNVRAQITVYTNKDNYTKNNFHINENSIIEVYDKSRTAENLLGVDIGFAIFPKDIISLIPDENENFEKIVYPELVKEKSLAAFQTDHRYYSVGDFRRLFLTENFLNRKPAIILDRDGVINIKAAKGCYVTKQEEFEWIPGSMKALMLLKKNNFTIIIATNQAGIARGLMTKSDLDQIHESMEMDLMINYGVKKYIDKIYVCPHGWDEGCNCRKPKPGMLFAAQKEFDLDLSKICFIGDDVRDKEAGDAAGCKTVLVTEQESLLKKVEKIISNFKG